MPLTVRDTFPLTHKQAVQTLVDAEWTSEERTQLLRASPAELHLTVGQALRNHWYLWEHTYPLTKHYKAVYGIGHADDMSSLIIGEFLALLQGGLHDTSQKVAALKKHWTDQGMDPLTLERTAQP